MQSRWENFVFSKNWNWRLARHFSFWLAWLIFHGVIYGSFWRGGGDYTIHRTFGEAMLRAFYVSFTEALIFMPVHLFLSYSIIYFLIPRYLFTKKYFKMVLGFVALLIMTALLSHLTAITAIRAFRQSVGLAGGANPLLFGLMAGLRGSNTVAGFATAIKLIKYWYLKNEDNQQLAQEKLQAELQALRGQLQPHFLFNTLNSLYSLTLHQSPQAPQMVERLSELLRYILTECNKPLVLLQAELSLLKSYIELEKIRFGDRLNIAIDQRGDVEGYSVAPLMLLPFVENCFKHGVRNQLEPVWITLHIEVHEEKLFFKLVNGKQLGHAAPETSTGIGLSNIRKRLELIYPNRHQLKITDAEDTFIVNLTVPLEKNAGANSNLKQAV